VLGSKLHAWLYRATRGRVLGAIAGHPVLLLTTTGRRTGLPRTTPLQYQLVGGNVVVVASNRGAPVPPAWFGNLRMNPDVSVRIGSEQFGCRARVAERPGRDELWEALAAENPWLVRAEKKARHPLPVVVLDRR
jgi:F420H(2)-dependent quinone reductase